MTDINTAENTTETAAPLTAAARLAALDSEREALALAARVEAAADLAAMETAMEAEIVAIRAKYADDLAALRKAAGKGPGRPVGSKYKAKEETAAA